MEKEFFKEEVEIQKVEVKIRDEDIEKIKKEMESCVQELQELKEMLVSQQDENKRTNLVLNTYMSREEDLKNRYIVRFNLLFFNNSTKYFHTEHQISSWRAYWKRNYQEKGNNASFSREQKVWR